MLCIRTYQNILYGKYSVLIQWCLQAEGQAGNESTKNSNEKESTKVTKISNYNDSTEDTKTFTLGDTVCSGVRYGCEEWSVNTKNMSRTNNYFGRIIPLVSECCIMDPNKIILCTEIVGEKEKSVFSMSTIEEEKKYLKKLKPIDLYKADCVQSLDAIPLNSDDFEESEI